MFDIGIIATIGNPYTSLIPPTVMVFILYKRKIPIVLNPLNLGLLLLFFWSMISGIVNQSALSTLASVMFLLYISLNTYIQNYAKDEKAVDVLLHSVWFYSMIAGILGLLEKFASFFIDMTWISDLYFKGSYSPTVANYRIYSTFGNPNVAGAWFAALVLLSIYLFEQGKPDRKKAYFASIFVFILALVATGSKGATSGLEFAILVYFIFKFKFKGDKKIGITLLFVFGVIAILALLSPEINHSVNSRTDVWIKSIKLFMDKPITGWGIFGIWTNIKETHAHNIWISMLSMFGIVGFVLYLWIRYYTYKCLYLLLQNKVAIAPFLVAIQALIIGHGTVDFIIMTPQGGILFFTSMSIIIGLAKKYEKQSYGELMLKNMEYISGKYS